MPRLPAFAVLLTCAAIGLCAASATGSTQHSCHAASCEVASAAAAAAATITSTGVGGVKLGRTYTSLRKAGQLGKIGPGCELGGPTTRSAPLRAPLRGSVSLSFGSPRRVAVIGITAGATARGVGIGSTSAAIRRAFPRAVFDHATDEVFGMTFVRVPKGGGGRLAFGVDTTTKQVTVIGIPVIPTCE